MKFIYLTLIGILLTTNLAAQDDNLGGSGGALQKRITENNNRFVIPEDIKTKVDLFFSSMVNKDYKKGLEKLMINSPISKKDEDFANILKQIGKAIELYGDIKGHEIIEVKTAGTSFYKINIIGLHQKYPTRWEINFYRTPEMGTIVTNFKFDDMSEIYLD